MVQPKGNLESSRSKLKDSANRLVIYSSLNLDGRAGASFQRLRSYADALNSKNVEVYFSSIYFGQGEYKSLEGSPLNFIATKRVKRNPSKIATLIGDQFAFRSHWNYCKSISQKHVSGKAKPISILVYPSSFASVIVPIIYFLKSSSVRLVVEKNELSYAVYSNRQIPGKGLTKLVLSFINQLNLLIAKWSDYSVQYFDGVICISTALEKRYKKKMNTIRVPILAKPITSITKRRGSESDTKVLCYTGVIADNKDKLTTVLDALGSLKKEGRNFQFNIYGPSSNSSRQRLIKAISENDLNDRVFYHGAVDGRKAMEVQIQSDLLIALRTVNMQNTYGFSTKLAEYLHSGTAVMTTDVGDNRKYLIDFQNAIVLSAELLSKETVTQSLNEILKLPIKELFEIGNRGKEMAQNYFSAEKYSSDLFDFFF